MSTTTLTRNLHRMSEHRSHDLGLGAVRMFQMGVRDGLDLPDADILDTAGRAFSFGAKVGRRCCRHGR